MRGELRRMLADDRDIHPSLREGHPNEKYFVSSLVASYYTMRVLMTLLYRSGPAPTASRQAVSLPSTIAETSLLTS